MQQIVQANGIELWVETFGEKRHPAMVLIMGNSCDGYFWPESFCKALAKAGFYVIRFDQRDTGLSSKIDFKKTPYTLLDMARDAVELLRALDISKAHVVGYSTGGAVAQLFAIHFPEKVLSLILLMTSIDLTIKNDAFAGLDVSERDLPPPKKVFIERVKAVNGKGAKNREEKVWQLVENFRLANGERAPFDEAFFYRLFESSLARAEMGKIGHESNHALATSATKRVSREELASIRVPTLVIGGGEDPILPAEHARALAKGIANARLLVIDEMGHVLNPHFFEQIVEAMAALSLGRRSLN